MSRVLLATESFTTEINGALYTVVKDQTRIADDHPLAKQNPEYFVEPTNELTYEIEAATKKPGEKRATKQKAE